MNVPLPAILALFLVLTRTSGLVMTAPILSSRSIPMRIKTAFVVVIGAVSFFMAGAPSVVVPNDFGAIAGLIISELVIGLSAGLASRLAVDAAQAGGQTAANALGLGYGAMVNPHSGAESSTMGELFSGLTLAACVALGVHREAFAWLATSLRDAPIGGALDVPLLAQAVIRQVIFASSLAVRVAYPIFAVALLGYASLGIIGRAAPQLSLSNIGFALTIVAGGSMLYVCAPQVADICAHQALLAFSRR